MPRTTVAADAADRAIVGFSPDSRYFAFEEYGTSDGSGFPYANIYIVDLEKDEWVEDTPVRVVLKDETQSVYAARHQALSKAAPIIEKFGTVNPARLLASNAVGESVTNPRQMTFRQFHNIDETWTIRLEQFDVERPERCKFGERNVRGFALYVTRGDLPEKEIYRDDGIPETRGCPVEYRLADVISAGSARNPRTVVLIHKLTPGFEGLDARFLALPVELPALQQ